MLGKTASMQGAPVRGVEGEELIETRQCMIGLSGPQVGRSERLQDNELTGAKAVGCQQMGQGSTRLACRQVLPTRLQAFLPRSGRTVSVWQEFGCAGSHGMPSFEAHGAGGSTRRKKKRPPGYHLYGDAARDPTRTD